MIKADRKAGMTQKQVAAKYGIHRSRVSHVETVLATNTTSTGTPGAVRDASTDARIKINPNARPVIAERVDAGEPVAQVAADYGVTERQVTSISWSCSATAALKEVMG